LFVSQANCYLMKKIYLFVVVSVVCFRTVAQQDPIYAQYIADPVVMNPAFTGANERFNAGIQYRTQWAGVDGNPVTYNFKSNIALVDNKVGVGIVVIQDKIGDNRTTEFNTAYSYKIKLSQSTFSFGLQAGVVRISNDLTQLRIRDDNDPNFRFYNEMKFNTGAGVLLKGNRYLVGFSVPRLLPVSISQGGQSIQMYNRNFYFIGAYEFPLTDRLHLRPTTLLRITSGASISADIGLNLNIENLYQPGIFTRNLNTYGVLFQMLVSHYRFGYVFEFPASQASSLRFTSHELTLGVSLAVLEFHDRSKLKFQ